LWAGISESVPDRHSFFCYSPETGWPPGLFLSFTLVFAQRRPPKVVIWPSRLGVFTSGLMDIEEGLFFMILISLPF